MTRPHSAVRSMATMVVTALAPVAVVAAYSLVGGEVPDPLPTHWNLRGQADDSTPLLALFIATLAMSVLLTVLTWLALRQSRQQRSDRMLVTAASWAAWLAATVFLVPMGISNRAGSTADVGIGAAAVLAVPLVPTVVSGLVWALQRVVVERPPANRDPASPIHLRAGERVTWVGRSSSGRMLLGAAVLLIVAVFLVFTLWPVANLLAFVALVLFWMHVVTVRVDDAALTVAWGPARWPRILVPMEQITGARSEDIEPLRWGGWGYRATFRGTSAVTRRGPGLVVGRRDRTPLAVTVDHPERAADLVDALVERQNRHRSAHQ